MFRRAVTVATIATALSIPFAGANAQWPASPGWFGQYTNGFAPSAFGPNLWLSILMELGASGSRETRQSDRGANGEQATLEAMLPPAIRWVDMPNTTQVIASPCDDVRCVSNDLHANAAPVTVRQPSQPSFFVTADFTPPPTNAGRTSAQSDDPSANDEAPPAHVDDPAPEQPATKTDAGDVDKMVSNVPPPIDLAAPIRCADDCAELRVPAAPLIASPEPSTIVLAATGIAGVALHARRRRARAA